MKEQIRSQYLKSLQGRVDSLMAQIEKYYEGSDMAEQNLRMIAHALHGSGSTFGYPEITRASAEVEESVGEEIIARIRVLIQVLEEVIAGNAVKTEYDQTVQDNGGKSDDCKHVLVVEDDPEVVKQIIDVLKGIPERIKLSVARDAGHAEHSLVQNSFDLVILDLVLPDKDGREILKEIKLDLQIAMPVLVLSGISKDLVRVDCMSLGADHYMMKPFEQAELSKEITKLLATTKEPQTLSLVPIEEAEEKNDVEEALLPLAGHTVLVVDDDQHLGDPVTHLMKDHGAAVEYAATGRQALDYLQLGKCSLVIVDVNMPLVDGFTVLEKIREANSMEQLPVIMLTATGTEDDIVKGYELGANDYILKPFSEAQLMARVRSFLK